MRWSSRPTLLSAAETQSVDIVDRSGGLPVVGCHCSGADRSPIQSRPSALPWPAENAIANLSRNLAQPAVPVPRAQLAQRLKQAVFERIGDQPDDAVALVAVVTGFVGQS